MKEYLDSFYEVSRNEQFFNIDNYILPFIELSKPENVRNFLSSLLLDKGYVETMSKIAYAHQNGFHKYVLYVSNTYGWKVRLHVWWDKYQKEIDYDIHDHSWSYVSSILLGEVTNELYDFNQESTNKESFFHYLYEIHDETAVSSFTACGLKEISYLVERKELKQGDTYTQHASILHKVVPIQKFPTATLVFHQQPFQKRNNVYKKERIDTGKTYIGDLGTPKTPLKFAEEIGKIISLL